MKAKYKLHMNFYSDWIEIIRMRLNSTKLFHVESNEKPMTICSRYFNLLKRSIEPTPRTVMISNEFNCPPKRRNGLNLVKAKIENGRNLTPHLSTRLTDPDYSDHLLNEWAIYHLHLGTKPRQDGFFCRTNEVLFARFDPEHAYFINVMEHGNWAKSKVIEIVKNNWPKLIQKTQLGISGLPDGVSDKERYQMRKAGVNVPIEVDGKVYGPMGGGIATSGKSINVVRMCDLVKHHLFKLEDDFENDKEDMISRANERGVAFRKNLYLKLELDENDIAYVIEKNSGYRWEIGTLY